LSNNFSSKFDVELKLSIETKNLRRRKKNTSFGSGDSYCNPQNPFSHPNSYEVIVLT
jgi:hypothetical protein